MCVRDHGLEQVEPLAQNLEHSPCTSQGTGLTGPLVPAGHGAGYTDTVVKGNPEQLEFFVFYIKDDYVIAAASLNFDPLVSVVAEALFSGRQISKAEAQSWDTAWPQATLPGAPGRPAP
nr:apoptosis-inducing factor 3-like [Pelodiscus sinensis]|eukprot:XP_006127093.1 apoptosis-inducing factor 3-like [Pelodiscus sinensis]